MNSLTGLNKAILFALLSRLLILAIAGLRFVNQTTKTSVIDLFFHWDGGWYLSIVREGYHLSQPGAQANVAFFPLYPLVSKLLLPIIPNDRLAMLVLSNCAFIFSAILLFYLTTSVFDPITAVRTVMVYSFFPLAFVYSLPYAEALLASLILASLYFLRQSPAVSASLGFLAALTRLQGIALLPALAVYLWRQSISQRRRLGLQLFWLLLIPLGVSLYFLYLYLRFADFLLFFRIQSAWDHQLALSSTVLWRLVIFLIDQPKDHYLFGLGLFDAALIIGFILILVKSFKLLPPHLFAYCLVIFLLTFSRSVGPGLFYPFAAGNRYLMLALPLYMVIAKTLTARWTWAVYLGISLTWLIVFSWNFFSGKWVF